MDDLTGTWNEAETAEFSDKGNQVRELMGERLEILRLRFFAHDGFTAEAEEFMAKKGMLRSDRDDLNALLSHAGLKCLPEI